MARPIKRGLSLFLFSVDFFVDHQVLRLCRRQGVKSIIIYVGILCVIYKEGYYLHWDDDTALDVSQFLSILQLSDDEIKSTVECCVSLGIFSKEMLDNHHILTSLSIQENYQHACDKYKRKEGVTEYSLLPENSASKGLLGVNVEETPIDAEEMPIKSDETPINSEETQVSSNSSSNSNINNNVNSNYIDSNSSTSISPEVQPRQDFEMAFQLFKMNYMFPLKELQKCSDWYMANEGHWADKSQAWRMYRVKKWEQKPKLPPRFEQKEFLAGWLIVIEAMIKNNAPLDVLYEAIGDKLKYWLEMNENNETILKLRCSFALRDELEKIIEVVKPFVLSMGASILRYATPKSNNNNANTNTNTPAPVVEDLP